MKKTVSVELRLYGSGKIVENEPGCFRGGIPEPDLAGDIGFEVWREIDDEAGLWNPMDGEGTVQGGFQINVSGTSDGFRKLGLYLLSLAELDSSADPEYHEHHELTSDDGRTRLHFILRKITT